MLAACLEVPKNESEWAIWAWHSKNQIDLIRQAITAKYGISLPEYVLFPWAPTLTWLQNNASAHSDFLSVTGLQGHDLEDLNFQNIDEVAAWVDLAYKELYDVSTLLGIG